MRRWCTYRAASTARVTSCFAARTCRVCAAVTRFDNCGRKQFRRRRMRKSGRASSTFARSVSKLIKTNERGLFRTSDHVSRHTHSDSFYWHRRPHLRSEELFVKLKLIFCPLLWLIQVAVFHVLRRLAGNFKREAFVRQLIH